MSNSQKEDRTMQILIGDLVENILRYSDNPGGCADYITSHIRELIGVNTVALLEIATGASAANYRTVSIYPRRKETDWQRPEMQALFTALAQCETPCMIDPATDLSCKFPFPPGSGKTFVIPLAVGPEKVGMIILLDLLEEGNTSSILESLTRIAGVISLILRNSILYRNMEQTVLERTIQLTASEKAARRQARENELIAEVGRIIGSTLNIEDIYERFAEKVREIIPFDRIAINTVNLKDYTRTIRFAKGDMFAGNRIGQVVSLAGTGIEEAIRTKSSILINSKSPEDMGRKLLAAHQFGAESTMLIPLILNDEVIGSLAVHSAQIDAYSEDDLRLAERMASQIAGTIANAQHLLELKQADEALRESEGRLQDIILSMNDWIWEVDEKGVYTYSSPMGYELLSSQDIIGKTPFDFMLPDEAKRVAAIFSDLVAKKEQIKDLENWNIKTTGEKICLLTNGFPILDKDGNLKGYRGVDKDITDRKQAEEELQRNHDMIVKLTSQVPGVVYQYRLYSDGRSSFPFASPGMNSIYEVTPEDVREDATPVYGRLHPDDYDRVVAHIQESARTLGPFHCEFRVVLPRQGLRWRLSDAMPERMEDGGTLWYGIISDISDRKQLEEEKLSIMERLQRAEKMESLGKLAGGVAHDMNNVIGVLMSYSELLMEKLPAGSPLQAYAADMLKSSEKGAAIIQDLLTLARRGVMVAEVVDINSIIVNLLATPELVILKGYHSQLNFKTDLENNLLYIKGSPVHLEKALLNLLANAAEAIAGRGEVQIRTENRYLDHAVQGYDTVAEGDYVVLTVADTGTGISSEDMNKMFEPFYTKKKMGRSGTGLGLAIVWGAVKDHNGYIDVRSAEGQGTTFTLYFPVTREKMSEHVQKIPIEQYMGQGESVLVVDDVKEQRQVATTLLIRLGYQVAAVSSGEEAVEYLKHNRADILVLDMILELGIDGLETYQRILEINPHQKAIIVSGFSETDQVHKTQELGAGTYVKKPYLMERVGVAIRDELLKSGSHHNNR